MSKRFIQVAAVLLLLLLVVVESGSDLKQRVAEEHEGMTFPMNTEAVEESGQEVNMENADKKWEDTILFRGGYSGVDAWMDFTNGVITGDGCFADVPQCLWGKWVVMEKWVNSIYGWEANVEDGWIGTSIELYPHNFGFENQSDERMYYGHVMAVEDPWKYYYEVGRYWELDISGDYYFIFEFSIEHEPKEMQEVYASSCILVSENEMVVFAPRHVAYKLEKTECYDVGEDDGSFEVDSLSYDICRGVWKAVKAVRTDGTLDLTDCMETRLVLSKYKKLSWRILGRSNETVDRFARLIGVGENNGYLVCFNLYETWFWDQMILIDDMTAILVKGDNLFWAIRTSDPVEDRIYELLP
ncbi:MAG: hypothetical protein HDQ98_00420 [Lachnospiraceae bacterium]|nr:hypothetical protein [Lachnospiraceae bacterium]